MKKVLFYGFFFVLGMSYSMAIVAMAGLPRYLWIVFTLVWAGLLGSIAWWRYRKTQTAPQTQRRPISTVLAEGLPALGLLVSVIGSAVEWEFIFGGQGRWWVGVLWLLGVLASILAARQNRRTTVIVVLRGAVALLVVGAIAQRTPPALVAAGVFGLALVLLEKCWRSTPVNRSTEKHG
jgi:hypothetical protein